MKTAILSLIIAIAVAAFSIFQFEKNNQESQQTDQALTDIQSKIVKINAEATQTKNTLTELLGKYQSLTLEGKWKLSEASHFLRLAAIELQISRDVPTSLRLLEAAEDLLNSIPDPKLLPLRSQIAKEKAALQALQLPDLEKLWSRVGALMDQIPSLPTRGVRMGNQAKNPVEDQEQDQDDVQEQRPLQEQDQKQNQSQMQNAKPDQKPDQKQVGKPIPMQTDDQSDNEAEHPTEHQTENQTEHQTNTTVPASVGWWKKGLHNTWNELKGLIKVQRHTAPIEPILNESEQALAKENLLLIFEQIRWAILQSNNTVYQESIQNAKQWLNHYFENTDSRTRHIQDALNDLAKIDLRPPLPDIGQALNELKNKG